MSAEAGDALGAAIGASGNRDLTVTISDGGLALLRSDYNLVAAPHGFRVCYLAVLAGANRSLAATTVPRYDYVRNAWKTPDRRVRLPT